MAKDRLSRKLAVILHAEVVDSATFVQDHENRAHEHIQAAFNRFLETIKSYGRTTRELCEDTLVAVFNRVSDAVFAALAFNGLNEKFNSKLNAENQPVLRIGTGMGEVIIADNAITRMIELLAQRLVQLTDSGGVVVQGTVKETVSTRIPFEFDSLGEQVLTGL